MQKKYQQMEIENKGLQAKKEMLEKACKEGERQAKLLKERHEEAVTQLETLSKRF